MPLYRAKWNVQDATGIVAPGGIAELDENEAQALADIEAIDREPIDPETVDPETLKDKASKAKIKSKAKQKS